MSNTKTKNKNSFLQFSLKSEIIKAVKEMGFNHPTPIQEKVIPHLISSDQDLIASAQTGTGKTAAFGLPVLSTTKINVSSVQTLILCPTRELCMQIANDLIGYSKHLEEIKILAVYGGTKIEKQIKSLKKGPQIVIGTPGRTKDLIKRKKLFVGKIQRLILDEADEMLSVGFKEQVYEIFQYLDNDIQIALFSATMPAEIENLTSKFMRNPIKILLKKDHLKNIQIF